MTGHAVERLHAVELTPMRQAIARRMSESKRDAPHFYVSTSIAVDNALTALERLNSARPESDRISVTAVLVRASTRALQEHPELNAIWTDAGLARSDVVNFAVAVSTDGGVIAPALLGCEELDLASTAAALRDLVGRARRGKLRGREMTEGTFTLSNLGMFPVTGFAAIVTPPQVAILATGAIERVPRFDRDVLVAQSMLHATVSADHRALDGADVARFLETLKRLIEETDPA